MSQENVEIVRRGYAEFQAWNSGDRSGRDWWFGIVAPDFEFIPSGAFVGSGDEPLDVEGFEQFLLRFWNEFEDTATDVHELIDAGDAVVARVTFRGKGKASGIDVQMDVFQIWTLRDGNVVRGTAAWSEEEAFQAAGLSE